MKLPSRFEETLGKKKKFASWESPSTDWSNSFWLGLKNISNQFVTGIHAKPNQSYHILKPCKRRLCHCTWGLNMVWSAALWLMEFAYSKKIILPIHSVIVGCQKLVSLFGIMHALRTVQLCIIVLTYTNTWDSPLSISMELISHDIIIEISASQTSNPESIRFVTFFEPSSTPSYLGL